MSANHLDVMTVDIRYGPAAEPSPYLLPDHPPSKRQYMESVHPPLELEELLRVQHGCISSLQATEKLRRDRWRRLTDAQWFQQVHVGVFRLRGTQESWTQRAWAAQLAMPDSLISHRSSARLLGIRGFQDDCAPVELTVPHNGSRLRHLRIRPHRTRKPDLGIVDPTTGLRVTRVERTLMDLASILPSRELPFVVDRFLLLKHTSIESLFLYFQIVPLSGRKNGRKLVRLLLDRIGKTDALESKAEKRALDAFRNHGLRPESQFWVATHQGQYRLDFAFPDAMLAVEIDGPHHQDPIQARNDRIRDAALVTHGWRVIRISVYDDFELAIVQIQLALGHR